jgi:hypothetical protein
MDTGRMVNASTIRGGSDMGDKGPGSRSGGKKPKKPKKK